jgi:hypothetical protein
VTTQVHLSRLRDNLNLANTHLSNLLLCGPEITRIPEVETRVSTAWRSLFVTFFTSVTVTLTEEGLYVSSRKDLLSTTFDPLQLNDMLATTRYV